MLGLDYGVSENHSQEDLYIKDLCSHLYTFHDIQPHWHRWPLCSLGCMRRQHLCHLLCERQCGKVGKSMVSGTRLLTSVSYQLCDFKQDVNFFVVCQFYPSVKSYLLLSNNHPKTQQLKATSFACGPVGQEFEQVSAVLYLVSAGVTQLGRRIQDGPNPMTGAVVLAMG